jgi:hypothetical protein
VQALLLVLVVVVQKLLLLLLLLLLHHSYLVVQQGQGAQEDLQAAKRTGRAADTAASGLTSAMQHSWPMTHAAALLSLMPLLSERLPQLLCFHDTPATDRLLLFLKVQLDLSRKLLLLLLLQLFLLRLAQRLLLLYCRRHRRCRCCSCYCRSRTLSTTHLPGLRQ